MARMFPAIKLDVDNKMGYKKYMDKWKAEGVTITRFGGKESQ